MIISGIYKIESKIKPKRIYIGSSVDFCNRKRQHLQKLRKNIHDNSKLQNHFNKYGEPDLDFSVLLGCEKEELIANEQFFIDSLNPWFNQCLIAGSRLGIKCSLETRQKISKNNKSGTPETRNKQRQSHLGKKYPKEQYFKIAEIMRGNKFALGYTHSDEAKTKISESLKGNRRCINRVPWNKGLKGVQIAWNKGISSSEETRTKLRLSHLGHKHTEESKAKLRGRKHSEETKKKISVGVLRYFIDKKIA
jgi:hypothetical protein